jgi:hypothetical protein
MQYWRAVVAAFWNAMIAVFCACIVTIAVFWIYWIVDDASSKKIALIAIEGDPKTGGCKRTSLGTWQTASTALLDSSIGLVLLSRRVGLLWWRSSCQLLVYAISWRRREPG